MYNLEGGVIWTQELKNAFKTGTTYCSVIHNQQEYNESNFLKEAELKDVKYVPNAGFIGQAVSKMLTIKMVNDEESNLNFENANVQFKIGAKYNDIIYYINYGDFIVNEPPENDDTNGTVKFIAYDYMIKFNQDYINRVSYPCTLKDLLLDICSQAGVELGSTTFQNEDFEVEDNQFEGKQLRDVLQHIAKCAFSWARIGQDNKLYLDFEVNNNINETITIDDYKMDAFKKANEYYGPTNKVTYADSDIKGQEISVQDDSSIATYGEKEIIIYDNYFAYNIEKRQELIQAGTALFGLRYMPVQNLELIGLVYLDCTDIIGVQDGAGTTYLTRVFSHIIKYNGAVSDTIETTGESDNEKRYSNPNNSIAQNSRTEIIVDRAKKEITAVIEEVAGQNQKIAQVTQTVDELRSQISDIADITTSLESNSARLEFENINQSEPIRVVIHPVGTNISKLYPSPSLKPSSNLKIRTRILRFTNTTTQEVWNYELPDDLLYHDNENYDEFQLDYEAQTCIINKKCKWNNDGTVGLLANERTDEYTFSHIELTDGDYTVQLIQYNSGYIFARMMTKNYYTDQFATRAELNSEISQTVDNINLSVNERLTNYSTTSQMNSAIDLKASEITSSVSNTYATKSELSSSTSSLNSKIDQTAQSINLTVDSVQEQVETAQSTADTATTKADNAQSSANSAQSTANSINNNLTTNYYTKTQTNSAINQKADSITSTVSQTYSTKTETTAAKNAAINSANASTDTKLQSYSTTTQMNTAIEQKANQITSTVSETYSTKTETNTAKNQAISSANSSTDTKLQSYSTTTQMNTAIEQKANQITSTVSQTYSTKTETSNAIDAIEIGARNYFVGTGTLKNLEVNKASGYGTYDPYSTSENKTLLQLGFNVGDEVTISFNWQIAKNGSLAFVYGNCRLEWVQGSTYLAGIKNPAMTFSAGNTAGYVTATVKLNSTSINANKVRFRVDNSVLILKISNMKVEKGNKATSWTPAPEEYSTTTEMNSAITQKANEINLRIDQIEDVTNEANGTKTVTLTNCVKGNVLELHIYGNNSVFQAMYPNDTLYPQDNLYPKGDSLITVQYANNTTKTYELGVTEVLRKNGSVYDEYVLESGIAKVIRRINSNGTVKTKPTTQNLGEFSIALEEGTNIITIKNYSADMYVKYAIKSAYTDIFATQVQMNSSITQTAEEINLEVSKKVDSNEVISKINQSAEAVGINANKINLSANDVLNLLSGNTINLSGKSIRIASNNFSVDENGKMTCSNANITGGKFNVTGAGGATDLINVKNSSNSSQFSYLQPIGAGFVNGDSRIDIFTAGQNEWGGTVCSIDIQDDDGGTYIRGARITTPQVIQTSLESQKKNFEKYTNALETLKDIDIYKYNLKSEKDGSKKHIGFVIGDNYKYSEEVTSRENDGADIYSFVSLCCQAIKEENEEKDKQIGQLQEEIEKLRKEIEK